MVPRVRPNLGGHHGRSPPDRPIDNCRRLRARPQTRQHSIQCPPRNDNCRARPRRVCRGLRFGDHRLAVGDGQSAAAPDGGRHPLARRRFDIHDLRRRLHGFGNVRSLEPQDRHADRRRRHDLLHLVDPASAKRRAADHRASLDRSRRRICRLGAVPDRRRADAGSAPANLRRRL